MASCAAGFIASIWFALHTAAPEWKWWTGLGLIFQAAVITLAMTWPPRSADPIEQRLPPP
jgi:hypothetical protein